MHEGFFIRIQRDLRNKCLVQNDNILKHIIYYSQQKYNVSVKLMLWKHNPLCLKRAVASKPASAFREL